MGVMFLKFQKYTLIESFSANNNPPPILFVVQTQYDDSDFCFDS